MTDYSRLTDNTRRTVSKAFALAKERRYPEITPHVMLVALCEEGSDMVSYIFQRFGVDARFFVATVSASLPPVGAEEPSEIPLSRNLEAVLEKAMSLAVGSGSSNVALEHILWAMSVVPGDVRDLLHDMGVTEGRLEEAVRDFREGNIVQPEAAESEEREPRHLKRYARNLTRMAEEGRLEPVIGRDDETRRILQILSRKTKNNPVLVGAPGTGKTAVVEGLAQRLVRGDVPQDLKDTKLYALDLPAMLAGAGMQGEFEDRLKKVLKDVKEDPRIVLFIDEMHLLVGAGRAAGAMDAANILKPELSRGEIRVVGATTIDEYTKYIESDKAFERRFQKVMVEEPDEETAVTIMRGIKQRFETFHRIKILDEAIVSAVRLSQRYVSGRYLPDKAIDLLDEAASRMKIERSSVPVELDALARLIRSKEMERESLRQDERGHDLTALDTEIDNLREKENALNARWRNERVRLETLQQRRDSLEDLRARRETAESAGRYEEAVLLKSRMEALRSEIASLGEGTESDLLKGALDDEDIRAVVTVWTGIPVSRLREDEAGKLASLESILSSSVIGQDGAVAAVSKVIRRNKMGFGDAARPIGSFLFMGTTGVGKTELAKTLAEYLFNSRDMLVRIDMSEYQQEHAVSRLFGAPPGYVGYGQGGQLTEAVRRKPYSVVLLDEIEKAHPKVFETLLQVLDDGRMTDGQGRTVNFRNTIVIMTSNIGMEELRTRLAPEFVNRIDDIVHFAPLALEHIRRICRIQAEALAARLSSSGIRLAFDESALDLLAEKGYDPRYGARPVKRAINDHIINPLTLRLLDGSLSKDSPILVSVIGEEFNFINADEEPLR
jgi:ATP-dependent Clp protease ATP-binding subunit ClpB